MIKQKKNNLVTLLQLCNILLLCCSTAFNFANASNGDDTNWQFKVFLDGDEIGTHTFSLIKKGERTEINSKARFGVDFLFINVYSYQHDDIEHWRDQCLDSIEAFTNDNGDEHKVSGKIENENFIVNTLENKHTYNSCIKTFAYWDPAFLTEPELLNSQTGEMIEVESQFIGYETMTHKGQTIDSKRYRLSGEKLQIDLWYSKENHWLALESLTEGGRVVRYAIP